MALAGRPPGLANLGNTCFLNSLLQCLNACGLASMMTPLKGGHPDTPHTRVYRALRATMTAMAPTTPGKPGRVLAPESFVRALQRNAVALGRPDFAGWSQNDVAELYTLLGECIHESTKTQAAVKVSVSDETRMTPIDKKCLERLTTFLSSEHSVAARAMVGIEASVVTSMEERYLSTRAECFYVLDVPIPPRARSVNDCVEAFGSESLLNGDNQYEIPEGFPNAGDHVDARQRHIVWLAPAMLVVETRLYEMTGVGRLDKGHARLEASPELRFPVWASGAVNRVRYELCGVAYHRGGGRQGGHYTAVVRSSNGTLWNCNDTTTSPLPPRSGWPVGGYCFFYRKIL
jgi:ubiquitin C-terminal hydrolase